ncbi:hypothetical protein BDB00DRAFT_832509 [Zychaea mexicana]|uniref:uncharacterized protein n=1 Tax=Zychaea mexicana TaxID=64656 RepID=UPI0022FDC3E6|nr:uncharacterized protein BDB00DRAFT_832509 [Zychaea mexicana]KAI9491501.1 hypothetical protein BDB00DRAFT_832509 [Zychaea mexicana]
MEQTEWRKPYTYIDHLQGASSCLEETVQKLAASVNLLNTSTQGYNRLHRVTQFEVHSEVIPVQDIRYAQSELYSKRLPEIEALLTRADASIKALEKEVHVWESKVEEQNTHIKALEEQIGPQEQEHQRKRQRKHPQQQQQQQQQQQRPSSLSFQPLHNLQQKKRAFEQELASLKTRVDRKRAECQNLQTERDKAQATAATEEATAAQEEEEAAETSSASSAVVNHAVSQTSDQTMTTEEDVHTLKQIKTLSKLLFPAEASAMVAQLLDQHVKIE